MATLGIGGAGTLNPRYYACNHCKHVLFDPVQDCCGNRLCRSCSFAILAKSLNCQECKNPFTKESFHTDKAAANMWLQCPNQGCSWKNQMKYFRNHFDDCNFKSVQCGACSECFPQEEVVGHRSTCIMLQDYDPTVFANRSGIQETRRFPSARYFDLFRNLTVAAVGDRLMSDIINATRVIDGFYQESGTNNAAPEILLRYFRCDGFFYWKISHFSDLKAKAKSGITTSIYSNPFYASAARRYKMRLRLDINGLEEGYNSHMSLLLEFIQGEYDALLTWPFNIECSFTLLNMTESDNHTCTAKLQELQWSPQPTVAGGFKQFIAQKVMRRYIKNDTIYLKIEGKLI